MFLCVQQQKENLRGSIKAKEQQIGKRSVKVGNTHTFGYLNTDRRRKLGNLDLDRTQAQEQLCILSAKRIAEESLQTRGLMETIHSINL